jgi:hypothetical protein
VRNGLLATIGRLTMNIVVRWEGIVEARELSLVVVS